MQRIIKEDLLLLEDLLEFKKIKCVYQKNVYIDKLDVINVTIHQANLLS